MRSPRAHRNGSGGGGDPPSPSPPPHLRFPASPHFQSTVAQQKLRRFNTLILVFRLAAFCFSFTAAVFMLTNSRGSDSPRWYDFDAFRFVLAANGIVAVYSLLEMGAAVWEISRGATVFPELLQVWFDFGHDQAFAYLVLAADAAGAEQTLRLKASDTCTVTSAFCVQADISVALGFAGFLFLGLSSLLSGYRVASFLINGSRFRV